MIGTKHKSPRRRLAVWIKRVAVLVLGWTCWATSANATEEEPGLKTWTAAIVGEVIQTRSVAGPREPTGSGDAERPLAQMMQHAAPASGKTLRLQAPQLLVAGRGGEVWAMDATDGSIGYTLGGRRQDDVWKPLYFCATGLPVRSAATFEDARERVLSVVLHDETDSVEVSAVPALALSGSLRMETWGQKEVGAPWDAFWVFMVDDAPLANWAHPCRYVFVASDLSSVAVRYALTPLSAHSRSLRRAGGEDELKVIIPFAYGEYTPGPKKKRTSSLGMKTSSRAGSVSNCYAVIVSGGYNTWNNHIRYWGDAAFIYSTLTLKYGYPKTNIYALISDGLDPAIDRSNDSNSPTDLDGDGLPDTYASATLENVTNVFIALQSRLQSNDQLFVYFTDHGSPGDYGGWSVELNLWNAGVLRDTDLKALTEPIRCPVFFAMEQCYSGGFIDDLNQTNRAIATAARYDESSYAGDTYPYFDQWAYHWTAAMRGYYPQSNAPWINTESCNADLNADGYVSFDEAAAYALAHKYQYDNPMSAENPAGLGKRLFMSMPARETLGVGELVMDPIPDVLVTNTPFALRITAQNVYGDVMTNYSGPAVLWMDAGLIDPGRYMGTGTLSWAYPFFSFAHDVRTQVIYPSEWLGGACTLDNVGLEIVDSSSRCLSNCTIRVKHTALDKYPDDPQWESSGWTVVYTSNLTCSTTGWMTLAFSQTFEYDGVHNLMVDFSFCNSNAVGFGPTCRAGVSTNRVSIYYADENEYGNPLAWSNDVPAPSRSLYYPHLRFGAPAYAREVRLEPSNLVGFVDGVWTGLVTVFNPAASAILRVSDAVHPWRGQSGALVILDKCQTNYVQVASAHPVAPYASWASAAATIQDAVNAAQDGNVVLVADGTYDAGGVPAAGCELTNRVCITNAITVRSVNGAQSTVIRGSGGALGAGAVRGVYLAGGAVLTGFAITNGRTLTTSGSDQEGGGVFLASSGGTVNECTLSGNQAASAGGAVYLDGNGMLHHCSLIGNYTLLDGGALYAFLGGTVNNCLLTGNSCGDDGGAVYLNSGGTMNNCTVCGNDAVNRGGGVVFTDGAMNNSVVWSNTANNGNNLYQMSGGTIRYSCAADGVVDGLNGNRTNNPLFFGIASGNYRLRAASPCVDAGDNTCAPTNSSPFDLLGHLRIVNGIVDMGAMEWQGSTCNVLGTNGAVIADGEAASAAKGTDFGSSRPGIAVARTLAISNPGDGVLTISAFATNGAGAASFRGVDLPVFIEPFSVSNFTVRFIPNTTGVLTAALGIMNDSTNSDYTVNLAGFSLAEYACATNIGPYAGGNEVTVTLGFPATVTNVLVGASRWPVAVSASGTNWFAFVLPRADRAGPVDFVIQSLEYSELTLKNIYTYNLSGMIGGYIPDRWVETVPLPVPRYQPATVTYSNAIYAIGGYGEDWDAVATVYRFDGVSWTSAAPVPEAGAGWGAAVWNDAVYIAGAYLTNVFRFDGSSWTEVAGLPMTTYSPLVAAFSNRLYVVSGSLVTNCFVYDGEAWTQADGLPNGYSMSEAAGGVLGSDLFMAGGDSSVGAATNHYRFNGTTWSPVEGLPQARQSMGTAVWRDRIYAIGGYDEAYGYATNVFSFDGVTWSEAGSLPDGMISSGAAVLDDRLYCVAGYSARGGMLCNVYTYTFGYPFFGVAPSNGPVAGGYEVILTGTHLGNGSDITNVTLCGVPVANIINQSGTQVVVVAGSGELGLGDVRVYSTSFGETVKSNAFTYSHSFILTVQSAHGVGTPPAGAHIHPYGATLTNAMSGLETVGTTQYVCAGWTLAGHDSGAGLATQMMMTVTNHAALTWLWKTNFYLTANAGPHGDIDRLSGWLTNGEEAIILATPQAYCTFTNWTGSVVTQANPLHMVMNAAKWVTANFTANMTTNKPTPQWWLAQYGLTNFEVEVLLDSDGDGVPTGDEWIMHTDPTNGLSFLRLMGMNMDGAYDVLTWPCATDRFYDVQYGLGNPGEDWMPAPGLTNLAPPSRWLVVTNSVDAALKLYRLNVRLPP